MSAERMTQITVSRRDVDYRINGDGDIYNRQHGLHIIVQGGIRLRALQPHERYMIRGTVDGLPRIYFLYCTRAGSLAEFRMQPVAGDPPGPPVDVRTDPLARREPSPPTDRDRQGRSVGATPFAVRRHGAAGLTPPWPQPQLRERPE